jgi:hypothetical protein
MKNYEILKEALLKSNYVSIVDEYSEDSMCVQIMIGSPLFEICGCFKNCNEIKLENYLNDLFYIFDMGEFGYSLADMEVLHRYLDEIRNDIPEYVEKGIIEYWCDNVSHWDLEKYIDSTLYSKIEAEIDELYRELCKDFSKFAEELRELVDELLIKTRLEEIQSENERIIEKYGCPKWDEGENYSFQHFIYMFSGDMLCDPNSIYDVLSDTLDSYEDIVDYSIIFYSNEDTRHYIVKTNEDRLICLNELL